MVSPAHRVPEVLLQWHLHSPIIFNINLFNDVFVVCQPEKHQLLRNVHVVKLAVMGGESVPVASPGYLWLCSQSK